MGWREFAHQCALRPDFELRFHASPRFVNSHPATIRPSKLVLQVKICEATIPIPLPLPSFHPLYLFLSLLPTPDKGGLWSWGVGARGRQGHSDEEDRAVPVRAEVEGLAGAKIVSAACGDAQSSAVTGQRPLTRPTPCHTHSLSHTRSRALPPTPFVSRLHHLLVLISGEMLSLMSSRLKN